MIAMTLWSILKTLLLVNIDPDGFSAIFGESIGDGIERKIIIILVFTVMSFDLVFRTFVGLKARSEGCGKNCGYFYLAVDAVFIFLSVTSLVAFFNPDSTKLSDVDSVVSILFELTTLYTCVSLMYASFKVKKLSRLLKEEA